MGFIDAIQAPIGTTVIDIPLTETEKLQNQVDDLYEIIDGLEKQIQKLLELHDRV